MTLLGSIGKRLLASAFIVLLQAAAATVSLAQPTHQKNEVLVVTTPHFRQVEQHGNEIASEKLGRIGNDVFTFLDFEVGGKTYRAWWRSIGSAPPIYLDDNLTYKFLLRLEPKTSECQVLKIWRREKLIWRNDKLAWQTPSPDERDIREELRSILLRQMEAFKDKDVQAYLRYMAPDFSTTTIEGLKFIRSRQELEADTLSQMQETLSVGRVVRQIKDLRVKGKEVTVLVDQKSSAVSKTFGSTNTWKSRVIQREIWITTDEGLKLSSIEALEIVYLIKDGELVVSHSKKTPERKRGRAGNAPLPTSLVVDAPASSHVSSSRWPLTQHLSGPKMPSTMSTGTNSPAK
jgi:hypothetical protein